MIEFRLLGPFEGPVEVPGGKPRALLARLLLDAGRVVAAGGVRDVLTDELIARHYGASVRVLYDDDGLLVVVPVRRG